MSMLEIIGRSLAVYVAVLVGLRLGGRRELGQLTPFDLVVILLVANAVQNAMVGGDTSLQGGLVAAATLLAVNSALARLRLRSTRLRHLVEGVPVVLIQHGALGEVEHVALAVLETDGSVSVVPMTASVHRTPRRLRHRRS